MKKVLFVISITILSQYIHAQSGYNNYDYYYWKFKTITEIFLKSPINIESNKKLYSELYWLYNDIHKLSIPQDEQEKFNLLQSDIKIFQDFIAPISNNGNSHLRDYHFTRLKQLYGQDIKQIKLKVNCPTDEIEFVEIRLKNLNICYLHNISKKTKNGLRIKYYAASGNSTSKGDFGALNAEYTPILHNVGQPYLKMISATILDMD